MAVRKYKCKTLKTDSKTTATVKKVLAELTLVDGAVDDEITVTALGTQPNGATGTIWVEIDNVVTNPFVTGREYYITFTEV